MSKMYTTEVISLKITCSVATEPLTEKQIKKNKKLKKKYRKVGKQVNQTDIILTVKKSAGLRIGEVVSVLQGVKFMVTESTTEQTVLKNIHSNATIREFEIGRHVQFASLYVAVGESSTPNITSNP